MKITYDSCKIEVFVVYDGIIIIYLVKITLKERKYDLSLMLNLLQ